MAGRNPSGHSGLHSVAAFASDHKQPLWFLLALALAAAALFPGLGSFGLWDPWEMQRAHLARTMAGDARVIVMEPSVQEEAPGPADEGREYPLTEAIRTAHDDLYVEGPAELAGDRASKAATAGAAILQKGLAALKQSVYHAVVLDVDLLIESLSDEAATERFAAEIDGITRSNDGTRVVLFTRRFKGQQDALGLAYTRGSIAEARKLLEQYSVEVPDMAGRMDEVAKSLQSTPGFRLDAEVVDTPEAVVAALADVPGVQWQRAQFKRGGETLSVPVLDHWLVAGAYELFGFSEWSSRLPFALVTFGGVILLFLLAQAMFGARVALLSTLVLITMPMTFGAGRNLAGEAPFAMSLMAAVGAFMVLVRGRSTVSALAALALSAVLLFLAQGLFGLLVLTLILGAYLLATLDFRRQVLLGFVATAALFGIALALVFTPEHWTFFDHFRFMHRLFSDGPKDHSRNFDYFIREIGFGVFPWCALLPFALGRLLAGSRTFWGSDHEKVDEEARHRGRLYALIILWFALPLVLQMSMFRDFSHIVLPSAPAMAIATGMLLARLMEGETLDRFAAFVAAGILLMLLHDIKTSPEPLVSFLAYDPPFTKGKTGITFPDEMHISSSFLLLTGVAILVLVNSFSRLGTVGLRIARFFQRTRPFWISMFVLAAALCLDYVLSMLGRFNAAFKLPTAARLALEHRTFPAQVLGRPEHVLGLAALFALAITWWGHFTAMGQRVAARVPRPVRAVGRGLRFIYMETRLATPRLGIFALLGLGAIALLDALARVRFPEGYDAGSSLRDPVVWLLAVLAIVALVLAATGAAGRAKEGSPLWRLRTLTTGTGRFLPALGLLAAWLLYMAVRLSKEAWMTPPELWVILALATVIGAVLIARFGATHAGWLAAAVGIGMVGITGSKLMPLVQKWRELSPVLLGASETDDTIAYVLIRARDVKILVLLMGVLTVNALWGRRDQIVARVPGIGAEKGWLRQLLRKRLLERLLLSLERGRIAIPMFVLCAFGITMLYNQKFVPALSFHVSQKHILDTYREVDKGDEAGQPNLFKHGSFGGTGDEYNFYTNSIPEVSDRNRVMQSLLHESDTVVKLTGEGGSAQGKVMVVQGFSDANDLDHDGRRDWLADAGVAESSGEGQLTDEDKQWKENQWAGYFLIDSAGRQFPITSNTANTLNVQGRPTTGRDDGYRAAYTIDHRDAKDHKATAMSKTRAFYLLPKLQFSELNYQFRKLSGGRHIPVLDDRSSRIVLTTSFLEDDEKDSNWIAAHVITKEQLAAIPGVHETYVNFEDKIAIIGWKMAEDAVRARDNFKITLYLEVRGEMTTSYKLFMHIDKAGTSNRIHSDHYVLNLSNDPEEKGCIGCFQTRHFVPGDIVVDEFEREVPLGTPGGAQDIWLGFYNTGNDQRLKVKEFDRAKVVHDGSNRVKIGSFKVR